MLSDLIKGAKGVERESEGRISARQTYRMVETGFLPVIRVGKTMYFRRQDIEAAFQSKSAE